LGESYRAEALEEPQRAKDREAEETQPSKETQCRRKPTKQAKSIPIATAWQGSSRALDRNRRRRQRPRVVDIDTLANLSLSMDRFVETAKLPQIP
jgi:hypothetical protein